MFSLLNWLQVDLKLYEGFCSSKMSFIIFGAIPFLTLDQDNSLDQEVQKRSNYSNKLI